MEKELRVAPVRGVVTKQPLTCVICFPFAPEFALTMATLIFRSLLPRPTTSIRSFCSGAKNDLIDNATPLSKVKKVPKTNPSPKTKGKIEEKLNATSLSVQDIRDDVRQLAENYSALQGVQWTRFPKLNCILKGHRRGELTVLTGPTGSGKTTFLSEYSLDLAMSSVKTLWGSFEIDNRRLILTMLNQLAEIRMEKHLHLFEQTYDEFEQLPIRFMNFHGQKTIALTLSNVIDSMSTTVEKHDTSHIIIDNLQFMMGHDVNYKNVNRFEFQDLIVHKFRKFATDYDCHVTVVIHPRKENTEELTNNSIFGGAKATQEADNVMILQVKYSGNSFKYKKYLQITKNRVAGDLGVIPLSYDREKNGFGLRASSPNQDVDKVNATHFVK